MSSLKKWVIQMCGGYSTIDDAIQAIIEKDGKEKYLILTLAVKKLFNTVGADDILKQNDLGQWMVEGKIISEAEKKLLIAEATQFTETRLWKILQKDVQYQSNRKMYLLSKSEIDLAVGKLWLYILDCLKTRLNSMSKGSGFFSK